MDAEDVYRRSTVLPRLLRSIMRDADAVTACSRQTLLEAEEFVGIGLGDRGSVVPNGVSLAELRDAQPETCRRPYFLAIGRHVRQKGFDVLIRAYADLRRIVDNAPDLVVAGDGPERRVLQALAHDLGCDKWIVFPGLCDRARTAALFAGCVGFVLPSRHEPQGIVVLEAMAAGKVVIASAVGGVPEMVHANETGILVPPEDCQALMQAMHSVLTDQVSASRLARAALIRASHFDWSSVAAAYTALYQRVLADRERTERATLTRTGLT
jgi:glycosyltransferase involved in cell wall biosynthesis